MPRVCTICGHVERAKIDRDLASGRPIRAIARQWRVTKDSLLRHRIHASVSIVKASERRELRIGESVLDEVDRLKTKVWKMLEAAEIERDRIGFTALTRELRQTLGAIFEIQNQAVKIQATTDPPSITVTVHDISAPEPATPGTPRSLTQ